MWERQNVVFYQKFICGYSPVGRSIVMAQEPIAEATLLKVMSAHNVAEALQDCFLEFLIYRLSTDVIMMNQPISVEECNQMEMMTCSAGRTFALFLLHTRKPSICHQ
jgi:hypothetical protein